MGSSTWMRLVVMSMCPVIQWELLILIGKIKVVYCGRERVRVVSGSYAVKVCVSMIIVVQWGGPG